MDTGPIIPRKWVNELARLRHQLGLQAFIAGGAVRDLILRRPHRDVDVWLPAHYEETARRVAAEHGWKVVVDGNYVSSDLLSVYEYGVDGETYNLIVTNFQTTEEIVGRFDFGISRASIHLIPGPIQYDEPYPVECELHVTPEFLADMARKVFKVRHDNGAARTAARWERLRERYPDWTFEDLEDPFAFL